MIKQVNLAEMKKKNDNIVLGNNKYTEQVTCKKCKNITLRDIEKYDIYKNDEKETLLYAIFIKKFKCNKCGSEDFESKIIEGQLVTTNIINIPQIQEGKVNTL